jgi:CDGSH-type Zn-finger protein
VSEALIAERGPFEAEVEAGKSYAWCAHGRSRKQPLCDATHATP